MIKHDVKFCPNDTVQIRFTNPWTREEMEHQLGCTQEQYRQGHRAYFSDGKLIREAFPFLDDNDREILISGTTPEQWDEMFGDFEDD